MATTAREKPQATSQAALGANDRLASRIAYVLLDADDEAFISHVLSGLIAAGFDVDATISSTSDQGIYALPGSLPILASQSMRQHRGAPFSEARAPLVDALGAAGATWNLSHNLALDPMSQAAAQQNFPALKSMAASGGRWLGLSEPSGRWERPDSSPLIHLASLARGGWRDDGAQMFKELLDDGVAELERAMANGAADPNHWIPALAMARLASLDSFDERQGPPSLDWRAFWQWAASHCQDFSRPFLSNGKSFHLVSGTSLAGDSAGLPLALAAEAGVGNPTPLLLGVKIAGIKLDARSMWAFSDAIGSWDINAMALYDRQIFAEQIAGSLDLLSRELPEFFLCQTSPEETQDSDYERRSFAQSCGLLLAPSTFDGFDSGSKSTELALLADAIDSIRRVELASPSPADNASWNSEFVASFADAANSCLASGLEDGGLAVDFGLLAKDVFDGLDFLAKKGPEGRLLSDLAIHAWLGLTTELFEKNLAWDAEDSEDQCFSVVFFEQLCDALGPQEAFRDLLGTTADIFLDKLEEALFNEEFSCDAAMDHARSARAYYEKTVLSVGLSANAKASRAKVLRV